jgi:hypothetical protein
MRQVVTRCTFERIRMQAGFLTHYDAMRESLTTETQSPFGDHKDTEKRI